jgi:CRP-like cAMP-binding protein
MLLRHLVHSTDDQRADLVERFAGRLTLRERNRIQVLLRSDGGDTDEEVADALEVCVATVAAVCKRFVTEGLEAALT